MKSFEELGFKKEWGSEFFCTYNSDNYKHCTDINFTFRCNPDGYRYKTWYYSGWADLDINLALAIALECEKLGWKCDAKTFEDLGFERAQGRYLRLGYEGDNSHYFIKTNYKGSGRIVVEFDPNDKEWTIDGYGDCDSDLIMAIIHHCIKLNYIELEEV